MELLLRPGESTSFTTQGEAGPNYRGQSHVGRPRSCFLNRSHLGAVGNVQAGVQHGSAKFAARFGPFDRVHLRAETLHAVFLKHTRLV